MKSRPADDTMISLRFGQEFVGADALRQLVAGHARHHLVEEDDVVGLARVPGPFQLGHGGKAVADRCGMHAEIPQLAAHDFQIDVDIVHHQGAKILEMPGQDFAVGQVGAGAFQRQGEPEGRALAQLAA